MIILIDGHSFNIVVVWSITPEPFLYLKCEGGYSVSDCFSKPLQSEKWMCRKGNPSYGDRMQSDKSTGAAFRGVIDHQY
jgi:hypothetical protein